MSFEISKEELLDLYIEKNMSSTDIAEKFNISKDIVKRKLKKYEIKKSKEKISKLIKTTALEKRKKTCMKKYGADHPNKNEEIKNKIKETYDKNNRGENSYRLLEINEKRKQTCIKRFGTEYALQNQNVKNKSKNTWKKKYGVDNPMKSKKIQEKVGNTCLKIYGVKNVFELKEFQEKADKKMKEKYGFENSSQCEELKKKQINTCLKIHGVPYFCMTEKCRKANGFTISKINNMFSRELFKNNIKNNLEKNLGKYSYDIEILDKNILIEINPTYTHNVTDGGWFNNHKKDTLKKDYHYNKTIVAKENGYRCIHIFDWDNKEKIINMLKPKEKIYARKCDCKEISLEECNAFLEKYHLQGNCKGQKIRIGLFYNDKLVEVMIFGKPRYNKKYEWELLRLCSHSDYEIIGGANRLFTHFLIDYKPNSIISYCDNSKFDGKVYKMLEFKLLDYGKPSKHWYNVNTKKHITDNLLRQRGFDQLFNTNYGKGTSNKDLMIENGFVEIYDSGQSTYIYNRNTVC